MINELIEQIGGRERLENLASGSAFYCIQDDEGQIMARALLAVLDAKPVGTVSIAPDWNSIPRRNIATVNMRPDLVMSEMRDGDNLYTTPPAASNVKLPTTRLWAGAIECYAKDDVISVLRSAGIEVSDD